MQKRCSAIVVMCCCFAIERYLPFTSIAAYGYDDISVWDGSIDGSFEGSGEPNDPFLIATAAQLAGFAKKVNNGIISKAREVDTKADDMRSVDMTYTRLLSDIDLNNLEWEPIGYDPAWEREGVDDKRFVGYAGSFDGAGHVIKNLKITEKTYNVGFFGKTTDSRISNLRIENAFISGARRNAGILVGHNGGSIDSCHVDGTMALDECSTVGGLIGLNFFENMDRTRNSKIMYSSANVTIKGGMIKNSGGFVGTLGPGNHFYNCISSCDITSDDHLIGGFAGSDMYNQFSSPGDATLSWCASIGIIRGKRLIGGFIGTLYYGTLVSNCDSLIDIAGEGNIGGFVGFLIGGWIENSKSGCIINGGGIEDGVGGFIGADGFDSLDKFPRIISSDWIQNDKVNFGLYGFGTDRRHQYFGLGEGGLDNADEIKREIDTIRCNIIAKLSNK
jgi:hypothetical protein